MNFRNFIYNGQQPGPAHSLPAQQLENQVACGPNSLCLPHNLCSTTTHHPPPTTNHPPVDGGAQLPHCFYIYPFAFAFALSSFKLELTFLMMAAI